jgi:hypothetical protein
VGARLEFHGDRAALTGGAAYAFSAEAWRHREELRFDPDQGTRLRLRYEDLVVPYGAVTPEGPNSIYTLVAGADDLDYLGRRGWRVEWLIGEESLPSLELAYSVYEEWSEPARTDWNLFSRDRGPRPNPDITEGTGRRLQITGRLARSLPSLRGTRLTGLAEAEIAGYGLGGDFDYDRYRAEIAADFHVLARDDARLRFSVGGARNDVPAQSRFYLGGPAVLRAYRVHEFAGDRVIAATLDYLVGTDPLARLGVRWLQVQLVPFGEIGAAWFDEDEHGFSPTETAAASTSPDWQSDLGLGLQRNVVAGATVRFDFAWRLDRGTDRLTTRFGFKAPLFDRFGEDERRAREDERGGRGARRREREESGS